MKQLPHSEIKRGTFLIATPEITGGIFFRSVLLLCEHSTTGSFALIVNKPLAPHFPAELLGIKEFANPRVSARAGGPVQANQMMLLHTSAEAPGDNIEICSGVFLGGDLQFLQEAANDPKGPDIALCFGYAGWGAGQLEHEVMEGGWLLHPASEKDIFHTSLEKLWQLLLRAMGGSYATLSMIPDDLSMN